MRKKNSEVKKKGALMPVRIVLRWAAFVLYVAFFFIVPLGLLFEGSGLVVGTVLTLSFLFVIRSRGTEHIAKRLHVKQLTQTDHPQIGAMVSEYSRRLMLPPPSIWLIDHPAVNIALYGFSRQSASLAITRGALDRLSREELSAIVGREMCYLWHGDIVCESWLSQFLALFDRLVALPRAKLSSSSLKDYPFRVFLRQVFLYPLSLVPVFLLRRNRPASKLDLKSVKLTQAAKPLAEALRLLEATEERVPLPVPFSVRHLFLVPPPSSDPLVRVFFAREDLSARIAAIEGLQNPVSTT